MSVRERERERERESSQQSPVLLRTLWDSNCSRENKELKMQFQSAVAEAQGESWGGGERGIA